MTSKWHDEAIGIRACVRRESVLCTSIRFSVQLTSCWSMFSGAGKHREFVDKHGQNMMVNG
jgi:hypothetical protein